MRCLALIVWLGSAASVWAVETAAPDPFAGTLYQSIAAVLVFVLLVVVLRRYAWGPILKGLQDRENKIKTDLEQAQAKADQAQDTLSQYQQRLAEAQDEAAKVIDEARTQAQRIAATLKDQTQAEIEQMRSRAQADINAAKQQAIQEIYTQAADLTTAVASRILQREINTQDHQQLIQESLGALEKARN